MRNIKTDRITCLHAYVDHFIAISSHSSGLNSIPLYMYIAQENGRYTMYYIYAFETTIMYHK